MGKRGQTEASGNPAKKHAGKTAMDKPDTDTTPKSAPASAASASSRVKTGRAAAKPRLAALANTDTKVKAAKLRLPAGTQDEANADQVPVTTLALRPLTAADIGLGILLKFPSPDAICSPTYIQAATNCASALQALRHCIGEHITAELSLDGGAASMQPLQISRGSRGWTAPFNKKDGQIALGNANKYQAACNLFWLGLDRLLYQQKPNWPLVLQLYIQFWKHPRCENFPVTFYAYIDDATWLDWNVFSDNSDTFPDSSLQLENGLEMIFAFFLGYFLHGMKHSDPELIKLVGMDKLCTSEEHSSRYMDVARSVVVQLRRNTSDPLHTPLANLQFDQDLVMVKKACTPCVLKTARKIDAIFAGKEALGEPSGLKAILDFLCSNVTVSDKTSGFTMRSLGVYRHVHQAFNVAAPTREMCEWLHLQFHSDPDHIFNSLWKSDAIAVCVPPELTCAVLEMLGYGVIRGDFASMSGLTVKALRGKQGEAGIVHIFCGRALFTEFLFSSYHPGPLVQEVYANLASFTQFNPSDKMVVAASRRGETLELKSHHKGQLETKLDRVLAEKLEEVHVGNFDDEFKAAIELLNCQVPTSAHKLFEVRPKLASIRADLDAVFKEHRRSLMEESGEQPTSSDTLPTAVPSSRVDESEGAESCDEGDEGSNKPDVIKFEFQGTAMRLRSTLISLSVVPLNTKVPDIVKVLKADVLPFHGKFNKKMRGLIVDVNQLEPGERGYEKPLKLGDKKKPACVTVCSRLEALVEIAGNGDCVQCLAGDHPANSGKLSSIIDEPKLPKQNGGDAEKPLLKQHSMWLIKHEDSAAKLRKRGTAAANNVQQVVFGCECKDITHLSKKKLLFGPGSSHSSALFDSTRLSVKAFPSLTESQKTEFLRGIPIDCTTVDKPLCAEIREGKTKRARKLKTVKKYIGHLPLVWRPTPATAHREMLHLMGYTRVVDGLAIDIQLALACAEAGVPYHGLVTSENHKQWFLQQLDLQILRMMSDPGCKQFFQGQESVAKLTKFFGDVKTPGFVPLNQNGEVIKDAKSDSESDSESTASN